MSRLRRLLAVSFIAFTALAVVPAVAHADCTNPMDPDFGNCSPPPGGRNTPPPKATPAATPVKTAAPTPVPTHHVIQPAPVTNQSSADNTTPEPTAFPVEVDTSSPAATTIVTTDQLPGSTENFSAEQTASASSWIFGFIVGLIVGGLIGRASWGLRRRRRQQIFG